MFSCWVFNEFNKRLISGYLHNPYLKIIALPETDAHIEMNYPRSSPLRLTNTKITLLTLISNEIIVMNNMRRSVNIIKTRIKYLT